jgi:sorbitol/mannitol transport system substrate-binding protein
MAPPTSRRRAATIAGFAVLSAALSACAGAGGGGGGGGGEGAGDAISVLMVGNPQMEGIEQLTDANFTADTGIEVNFTILPENELRDRVTQDVATKGGQYDVVTIGAYEAPIWAGNGWLKELGAAAKEDADFDYDDLLEPMVTSLSGPDGGLYGMPFYGESSFLMYRKDIFDAKGLTMPERPTWQQVAEFAAQVDEAEPGMAGICLRGLPGWGELFAPLTTVVNTFGGTFFCTRMILIPCYLLLDLGLCRGGRRCKSTWPSSWLPSRCCNYTFVHVYSDQLNSFAVVFQKGYGANPFKIKVPFAVYFSYPYYCR